MKVDLYSERMRLQAQAGKTDVYQYDAIPVSLRIQIAQVAIDMLGIPGKYRDTHDANASRFWWSTIDDVLRREYGVHQIGPEREASERVPRFLEGASTVQVLDTVELIGRVATKLVPKHDRDRRDYMELVAGVEGLEEINLRFRRAGVGYQYEDGEMIRVDSQHVHAEIVKPTLRLLSSPDFAGANLEYRAAHAHFRNGDNRDALVNALNALESVIKTICDKKGWAYPPNSSASKLIDTVKANGLIPAPVASALMHGVPTIRNRLGGHGQGQTPIAVSDEVAAFTLHSTASAIIMLAKAAQLS